jgi:hypothetical protein
MDVVRRISLLVTAGLFAVALAFGAMYDRPVIDADAASQLSRSTSFFDSTIVLARNSSPRGPRGDALTVGLTYLERLRLGLGSPFRLVDQVLDDPRFEADPALRTRVVWGLLGRLRRGDAYVVDSSALDGLGPWDAEGRGATGAQQLALIEHTIESASDPRAGELAVRLAYMIAAGKAAVSSSAVVVATEAAALVRDRILAQRDLADLLADASRDAEGRDVLTLLEDRRESNAFRVERPAAVPLDPALRVQAMNAVPALVRALDTLQLAAAPRLAPRATQPLLGAGFAARARVLGADLPPSAPIVVASRLRSDRTGVVTNEETLVAAYDADVSASDSAHRVAARLVLSDAVAMRAFAQQRPWLPGDSTITAAELAAEFELGSVTFGRDVPRAWRPYYLGELETAIVDMKRVFPALSFAGLNIQLGNQPLPDSALAMHDPRTRTLELSVSSSAGTIAHELSHDLDWQTARHMYVNGRGYSTDRAMADKHGALAASVRGLAEARVVRGPNGPSPTGGPSVSSNTDRPAELFARSVDWFVASSLALQGRSNGFLTAVQDPMLPGYAAGAPAAVGSAGTESLLGALEQMTFVPDSARDAFAARWSDAASIDPTLMVRRVLDAPVSWRVVWQQVGRTASVQADAAVLGGASAPVLCPATSSPEAAARERLLALAIDARARGAAIRRARFFPSTMRTEWTRSVLDTPPWRTDAGESVVAALRVAVANELSTATWAQGVVPVVPSIFRASSESCSSIAR